MIGPEHRQACRERLLCDMVLAGEIQKVNVYLHIEWDEYKSQHLPRFLTEDSDIKDALYPYISEKFLELRSRGDIHYITWDLLVDRCTARNSIITNTDNHQPVITLF